MTPSSRSPCLGASDYVFFLKRQIDKGSNNPTSDEDDEMDDGHHHHGQLNISDRMTGQGSRSIGNGSLESSDDLPKLSELLRNLSDDLKSGPIG